MRKLWLIFLFLLFVPLNSSAMDVDKSYWVCDQVGQIDKELVLVTSGVTTDNKGDYNKKIKSFIKRIEKVINGRFRPSTMPACYNYKNKKKAYKIYEKRIKMAKKRNFRIFHIKMR